MAEALNNEETIGNYAKSRTIVGMDGELRNVISGASLRHNHQLHLKSQFSPDDQWHPVVCSDLDEKRCVVR